jgi:hypothetical protein
MNLLTPTSQQGDLAVGLYTNATMHTPMSVTLDALAKAKELGVDCCVRRCRSFGNMRTADCAVASRRLLLVVDRRLDSERLSLFIQLRATRSSRLSSRLLVRLPFGSTVQESLSDSPCTLLQTLDLRPRLSSDRARRMLRARLSRRPRRPSGCAWLRLLPALPATQLTLAFSSCPPFQVLPDVVIYDIDLTMTLPAQMTVRLFFEPL